MTRARIMNAGTGLSARVAGVIQSCLGAERDARAVLADVADMRMRLDRERPARSAWDLKEARGGLFDVEFIAQGLQLVTACSAPAVLRTNTLDALSALGAAGALSPEDASDLSASLRSYQNLLQVLRLTVGEKLVLSDMSASLQTLIADTVGLGSLEAVEAMLVEREAQVRSIFDRVIGPTAGS